jgi:hypothetical protein
MIIIKKKFSSEREREMACVCLCVRELVTEVSVSKPSSG